MANNLVYFDVFKKELEVETATKSWFRMGDSVIAGVPQSSLTSGVPGYTGGSQSFSLEMWIQVWSIAGTNKIVFRSQSASNLSNSQLLVRLDNTGLLQLAVNNTTNIVTTTLFDFSTRPNHIAITYNAATTTYKIFQNGVERASQVSATVPNVYADTRFALGDPTGFGGVTQRMALDEVRFWRKALTSKEIKDNYLKRIAVGNGINQNDLNSFLPWIIRPVLGLSTFVNLGNAGSAGNLVLSTTATSGVTLANAGFFNLTYTGRFDNWQTSSVSSQINSSPTSGSISVAGDGLDPIVRANQIVGSEIDIKVFNATKPNGFTVYSGQIEDNSYQITTGDTINIYTSSYIQELSQAFARNPAGDYQIAFGSQPIHTLFKLFLDRFRIWNNTKIYYTDASIPTSGDMAVVRGYTARGQTWLKAIEGLYKLLPATWFFRIENDGLFVVKQVSTTADHIFTLGADIIDINDEIRTSSITNEYLGYNDPSSGTPFVTRRANEVSILKYGHRTEIISDNRFNNKASMDAYLDRKLAISGDIVTPFSLTLSSKAFNSAGYPIEDIKVGDTFAINGFIDQEIRLITKVDYNFGTATIYSEDIKEFTNRRTNELKDRLDSVEYSNSPTTF